MGFGRRNAEGGGGVERFADVVGVMYDWGGAPDAERVAAIECRRLDEEAVAGAAGNERDDEGDEVREWRLRSSMRVNILLGCSD